MKKLTVIVVAALVAFLVAAAPVRAELEPRVPADWGIADGGANDGSGNYTVESATWTPQANWQPTIGDELRGVLDIESFDGQAFDPTPGQLTAIFYDLRLIEIGGTATDPTLYFGIGDEERNPLPGSSATAAGVVEIYEEASPGTDEDSRLEVLDPDRSSNPGTGPQQWSEGAGGTSRDQFTNTSTDGDLWMSAAFLPVGSTPGKLDYYLEQDLALDGGSGVFQQAFLEIVDAPGNLSNIAKGSFTTPGGTPADMTITGQIYQPDVLNLNNTTSKLYDSGSDPSNGPDEANWQVQVTDPFTFVASGDISAAGATLTAGTLTGRNTGGATLHTPEPGMASLLGLSLVGLLAFRRKEK